MIHKTLFLDSSRRGHYDAQCEHSVDIFMVICYCSKIIDAVCLSVPGVVPHNVAELCHLSKHLLPCAHLTPCPVLISSPALCSSHLLPCAHLISLPLVFGR